MKNQSHSATVLYKLKVFLCSKDPPAIRDEGGKEGREDPLSGLANQRLLDHLRAR